MRIDKPPGSFGTGWVRSWLWMIQSCDVDLVGLDVLDLAVEGFSTEDSEPVGGFVGGVHVLFVLPQRHSEQLVVLFIGQEQVARVPFLHPQGGDEVLFYLMVSLSEALGTNVEPGYPGEHGSTAFLLEGLTIPLCRTLWPDIGVSCQVWQVASLEVVVIGARVDRRSYSGEAIHSGL